MSALNWPSSFLGVIYQIVIIVSGLGLSISYDCVLQLSTDLANAVCRQYKDDIVCPPDLRKNVFTTSAVNNIDHIPSSTTALARDSFHGTIIFLTNHVSDSCLGEHNSIHVNT